MAGPGRPALVVGFRGRLAATVLACGPGGDLHAGRYGGAAPNALDALCRIVARLHDRDGAVAIPGFYRRVAAPPGRTGEGGYSPAERSTVRPALSVTEVWSGAGGRVAIPGRARCRLDLRLVPDQRPDEVARLLSRRVHALVPAGVRVAVTADEGAPPVTLPVRGAAVAAAARAVRAVWGVEPARVRSGGTVPAVAELHRLGIPVVVLGLGLPGDHAHAANENIELSRLLRGAETVVQLLRECAR
jgi:acetylornithine deacetylase/succinyl-diaminopimelate desuccinylase-like protein